MPKSTSFADAMAESSFEHFSRPNSADSHISNLHEDADMVRRSFTNEMQCDQDNSILPFHQDLVVVKQDIEKDMGSDAKKNDDACIILNLLTQNAAASSASKMALKFESGIKDERSGTLMYDELIEDQNCLEIIRQLTQATQGQIPMDSQ